MDRSAEEAEILRENLPQCRSVHYNLQMTGPGLEHGPSYNRLAYSRPFFNVTRYQNFTENCV
jgi:hypothetical protein